MAVAWASVAAKAATLGGDPLVPLPAGTVLDSILVAVGLAQSTNTITAPSGDGGAAWTKHAKSLSDSAPLWWKKCNATEPAGGYQFVTSGSASALVQVIRVTGVDLTNPIEDIEGITAAAAGAFAIPSVTATLSRFLMSMVNAINTTSFTPPGTTTERYDAQVTAGNLTYAGGDEVIAAGATGTRTWTRASGSASYCGYNILLKPLAPLETTGSSAGAASVAGTGAGVDTTTGSAPGTGAAAATGAGVDTTTGAPGAGAGAAAASGGSVDTTTGQDAGAASVAGSGGQVDTTTGQADGTAAAAGSGSSAKVEETSGSAAGSAAVSGEGSSIATAEGSADGEATADGAAAKVDTTTGQADGTATADAAGGATAGTTGTSDGSADVEGEASTGGISSTTGEADGAADVEGVGGSTAGTVGDSDGQATASGDGSSIRSGTGTIVAGAAVQGAAASVAAGTGSADGSSIVEGYAVRILSFVGTAAGTSTADGVGDAVEPIEAPREPRARTRAAAGRATIRSSRPRATTSNPNARAEIRR